MEWRIAAAGNIYGMALWWRCELVPGIWLSTSPADPATHWEQVYAPLHRPLNVAGGDVVRLIIESETGGGESGIAMRWQAIQLRDGQPLATRQQDIGRGFIG